MTVPDQIKNVIGPVVNGRIYADEAPQRAKPPFVVFERTSEEPITTIHRLPAATIIQYYSINVWDQSCGRVEQLAQRVKGGWMMPFLPASWKARIRGMSGPMTRR